MAKELTAEETPETGKEVAEETTSTPKESLTQPLGETEGEILKAPFEEENEANAESVKDFGGLFEDEEKQSEEELTGETGEEKEEEPQADDKKEEPAAAEPKGIKKDEKVEDKKEPEEKAEPEKKEEEEEVKPEEKPDKKDDKPPEGYVPKQALREARDDIKVLRDEVAALKETVAPQKSPETQADQKWKDFKVLSDDEYDQLVEDDPQEALKYSHKLRGYEAYASNKYRADKQLKDNQQQFNGMVDEWTDKINKAVPGVFDEDSEVASELAEFAAELGFENEDYLSVMTDPRTLVIPHGQKETFFLGPGVEGLLKVLSNAKSKITSGADETKIREEITKELTADITKRITKQITEKVKGAKGGDFKSITEVPGGGEEIETGVDPKSEEDWAALRRQNPEKAKELLGG